MILISCGHHKNAQGAKFEKDGVLYTEYNFANIWADKIVEIIGDQAIRVPNGTLKEKVEFINSIENVSIAVEVHFNSYKMWKDQNANGVVDDGEMVNAGRGSETLYYPSSKTGKEAARVVQGAIAQIMKPDRGIKEGWYQMNPSKGADFFLKRTHCTSLIVEPEFIDNIEIIIKNEDSTCHAIASALIEIKQLKDLA